MPEEDNTVGTKTTFQELPDAPPRRKIRFTVTGKIGIFFVVFWILMVFIGPYLSPYNEADILDESLFIVPGGDEYPDTDYQPPSKVAYLGTDYLGRDTLSRILYGARTTIGISFAATLLAYLLGVTLGIAATITVVPPGPNPFSCFKPARGISSINGLFLSKSLVNFSLVSDFPLSLALFNASSLP